MRRKEVADAIRPWGLKPRKITRVRAAFKVSTSQGTYCLKEVEDSEKRLSFYDSVLRYVQSQGFTMLAPYIPTLTGECFAVFNGRKVVVLPWLEGKEISYTSVKEIAAAAEALARFHQAAEGYQPEEGIQVKDKLGKWPGKLARKVADLEMYREQAEKGDTEFDRYFLQYVDWIYAHTVQAAQQIRQSPYYAQVEESRGRLTICHGDPSKRNFIRDQQGQMHLIDFESMKSDLPILDFWRLLRRTLARDMWDFTSVKQILDAYNRGRTMSREEYELLGIFLTFPEKIWRIVHNYYEPSKKQGWTMKRFIRHLQRQLEQVGKMEQFLAEYQAAFMTGEALLGEKSALANQLNDLVRGEAEDHLTDQETLGAEADRYTITEE
jgi:CotS family spore coat protein